MIEEYKNECKAMFQETWEAGWFVSKKEFYDFINVTASAAIYAEVTPKELVKGFEWLIRSFLTPECSARMATEVLSTVLNNKILNDLDNLGIPIMNSAGELRKIEDIFKDLERIRG